MPEQVFHVNPPELTPAFRQVCANVIQQFQNNFDYLNDKNNLEATGNYFRWLRCDIGAPEFDHVIFSDGNKVYSVIINLLGPDGFSLTPPELLQAQLDMAAVSNFIPCLYQVDGKTLQPLQKDLWNLVHAQSKKPVTVNELPAPERIPMTRWEMHNLGVTTVFKMLVDRDRNQHKVWGDFTGLDQITHLDYCDLTDRQPSIWVWFKDGSGCWIVVQTTTGPDQVPVLALDFKVSRQMANFSGYAARINLTDLVEKKNVLYRDSEVYVRFTGFKKCN